MCLVCNQVTEYTDSSKEVEFQVEPALALRQDVQSGANEATEFTKQLKSSEATEHTNSPEEELEQSTGPSLNNSAIHLYYKTSLVSTLL